MQVSDLVLGTMSFGDGSTRAWHLDEHAAEPIIRRALDAGITTFDTADMYSRGASERITGTLLRRLTPRREDYVLATKVFYPVTEGGGGGLSRRAILSAIDASLGRLGLDHVDLYQLHRWDPETPIDETMDALHDVVRSGKARYVGASAMWAWQFAKAQHAGRPGAGLVSMQCHYNLVYREEEREMLPLCADQGVGVLPYSPLARGLLAGRQRKTARTTGDPIAERHTQDAEPAVVDAVEEIATERGVAPAAIAIAWLMGNPVVTAPIVGATAPEQLDAAIAAREIDLSDDERSRLTAPYRARAVVGHA